MDGRFQLTSGGREDRCHVDGRGKAIDGPSEIPVRGFHDWSFILLDHKFEVNLDGMMLILVCVPCLFILAHVLSLGHHLIDGRIELPLRTFKLISDDVVVVPTCREDRCVFRSGRDDLSVLGIVQ